jgi:hypothetical protein
VRAKYGAAAGGRPPAAGLERVFLPLTEASSLERHLRPLSRRLRWRRSVEYVPRAVLVATLTCLAAAVVARLFALPGLLWLGAAAAILVFAWALGSVVRRQVGPFETARNADATLHLRERLATALELLDRNAQHPLALLQVRDATTVVVGCSPKEAFPIFAPGSQARRAALRTGGLSALALALIVALVLWPATGARLLDPASGEKLAMADAARPEDDIVRPPSLQPGSEGMQGEAVEGLSERPDSVGETPGLLGQNAQQQPGEGQQGANNQSGQQAQQDAQTQQNPNVAERQQALQDLGNALRQSQTGRQAGESLRRGDTERAGEQLNQMASQTSALSPGERQTLAEAFRQASEQIGNKDRPLADAAARASSALSQFQNQAAQQAIRDAANQVRDTGQQARAQQDLAQRAQDMQRGGQPQLPQNQGQQAGQQAGSQGSQGSQAGQQAQQPRQGGEGGTQGGDLSELEAALRGGGLQGAAGGPGAGSGSGSDAQGRSQRLAVDARTVQVEAEVGEGPTQWRPPSPNAAPAAAPASAAAVPSGPASAAPVGSGLDINSVPPDLADSVRQYFSPERPQP